MLKFNELQAYLDWVDARQHENDLSPIALDLRYNGIGAEGARHLAVALEKATQPITLDLRYNDIGAEGARHLAGALEKATQPITLNLGSNDIGAEGARHLAGALEKATQPITLDLQYNVIGAEGARHLATAIRARVENRTLPPGTMIRGVSVEVERLCRENDRWHKRKAAHKTCISLLAFQERKIPPRIAQYIAQKAVPLLSPAELGRCATSVTSIMDQRKKQGVVKRGIQTRLNPNCNPMQVTVYDPNAHSVRLNELSAEISKQETETTPPPISEKTVQHDTFPTHTTQPPVWKKPIFQAGIVLMLGLGIVSALYFTGGFALLPFLKPMIATFGAGMIAPAALIAGGLLSSLWFGGKKLVGMCTGRGAISHDDQPKPSTASAIPAATLPVVQGFFGHDADVAIDPSSAHEDVASRRIM